MFKIIIDPGHTKGTNKGILPDYREGTQMWKLSQYLMTELAAYECETVNTRPNIEDNPELEERGKMAADADLFISLHSNAVSGDQPDVTGSVTFYSLTRATDKTIAEKISETVSDQIGHYSRGAKTKKLSNQNADYYAVIRHSINAGCLHSFLVEHGFHTNLDDATWLMDDGNLQKLAKAEAELITSYYDITVKRTEPIYPAAVKISTESDEAPEEKENEVIPEQSAVTETPEIITEPEEKPIDAPETVETPSGEEKEEAEQEAEPPENIEPVATSATTGEEKSALYKIISAIVKFILRFFGKED